MLDFPEGKRYNTFTGYYRKKYGERLQKLVLDAGFSCPNRDGKISTGGCTFCDNAAFHPAYSAPGKPLLQQLDEGIEFHKVRYSRARHYLAYFQAFSNTYGPIEKLKALYTEVLKHPDVVGIVLGTRPDCVDEEKLDFLKDLQEGKILEGWHREGFDNPLVVVEYGIESCNDSTLRRINRGHDFETSRRAIEMTAERGIETGGHMILGLPGESRENMIAQCSKISALPLTSVKFHQLQLVKGTKMEKEFASHPEDFLQLGLDDYLDFIIEILEHLRPDLYIERVAGEVPPRFVEKTQWGLLRNVEILRLLDKKLEEKQTWQGRKY
ncbi:MAG: TIGR01212 family radical SAM protein [Bacteroidales bacterium]|nr:TIGR01212 family radical SAM protein [Bacteroidales bacterium]